jgi:hypothetical protein
MGGGGVINGADDVVLLVAALPILYAVLNVTTKGVLYSQPVRQTSYSNVHPRHLGRCNDVATQFHIFHFYDLWQGLCLNIRGSRVVVYVDTVCKAVESWL